MTNSFDDKNTEEERFLFSGTALEKALCDVENLTPVRNPHTLIDTECNDELSDSLRTKACNQNKSQSIT